MSFLNKNIVEYSALGVYYNWMAAEREHCREVRNYIHKGEQDYDFWLSEESWFLQRAKYESHRDYTDIQYMIRGTETMTYAPVDALNVKVPYNEEKDCVLYDNANPGLKVVVGAGEYMIFQPWDGHKPKAADGEPAPIKKVIVKIKEN